MDIVKQFSNLGIDNPHQVALKQQKRKVEQRIKELETDILCASEDIAGREEQVNTMLVEADVIQSELGNYDESEAFRDQVAGIHSIQDFQAAMREADLADSIVKLSEKIILYRQQISIAQDCIQACHAELKHQQQAKSQLEYDIACLEDVQ